MKVIVVGPGEGSVVGKLIAKEFEEQGISIADLKEHYQEVSVDVPDSEFHLKNLVHEYVPIKRLEPLIESKKRSYSTKFRDKK